MSSLSADDAALHHEDGSHRWAGGGESEASRRAWRARVEDHVAEHQASRHDGVPRRKLDVASGGVIPRRRG
jgi:hypothetical protein